MPCIAMPWLGSATAGDKRIRHARAAAQKPESRILAMHQPLQSREIGSSDFRLECRRNHGLLCCSVLPAAAQPVQALLRIEAFEEFPDLRMTDRLAGFIVEQVLF